MCKSQMRCGAGNPRAQEAEAGELKFQDTRPRPPRGGGGANNIQALKNMSMLAIVSVLFLLVKKNIIILSNLSIIVYLFTYLSDAGEGTKALDILRWRNITELQPLPL